MGAGLWSPKTLGEVRYCATRRTTERHGPPSVLLFISDQQRADTMPGMRKASVAAPHLEWLVRQSTLFTKAYCTTPMCSPSRSSLLSGLYPHATGMVANHQERAVAREMRLPEEVHLLADYLRPNGYRCGYVGKWHLGTGSDRRGFKDLAVRYGVHDVDGLEDNDILQFAKKIGVDLPARPGSREAGGKQTGLDPDPNHYDPRLKVGRSRLPLAFHTSFWNVGKAVDFIRESAQPFLLVYSCYEPHPPFVSPHPFDQMYSPDEMPLPDNRRDRASQTLMAERADGQLTSTAQFSDQDLRRMWAAYYGQISYLDHLLGVLLGALIETDQFENTLLIFTSDHGEMLGSHDLLLKGAVFYEEVVNVPLLVKPPRNRAQSHQTDQLVSLVDLAPTILHWCNVPGSESMHGRDLRSLVEGGNSSVHDGIALEYHSNNWGDSMYPLRGWREKNWKYVENQHGGVELYDLRRDPHELENLIASPDLAKTGARLQKSLRSWQAATNDDWPKVKKAPGIR